jgi:uncharacterized integral membrane protein
MKNQGRLISAIILILVVAIFALLNTQKVVLHLMFWQPVFPLVIILIVSVLLGALIAALLSTVSIYQLKKQVKELSKEHDELEEEIKAKYEKKLVDQQGKYQKQINSLKSDLAKSKESH